MGQPVAEKDLTQTEISLEEFRQAGAPIVKARRPYVSKKMEGFNAEVYTAWIERWANNAASNYPVVRGSHGVSFLRNCAKGVPAIVVGIGPSLDDEINDLRRAPRHAVIIATDAALRPLARYGIKPDIVLNFDARDEQKSMWEMMDTSPYVLLANSVTSPFTVEAWKGSLMFFNMMQSDDEFASNILPCIYPFTGQLPNMGTVGNGAVFLAHFMGCSPIMLVGMDLCYRAVENNGWRYRCKDWRFENPTSEIPDGRWVEIENKTLYDNDARVSRSDFEEIKGVKYRTDETLHFYRNSLVSNIGQLDVPAINCSGGVMENLIRTMPLREALETKCYNALDPGRTIAKHLAALLPRWKDNFSLVADKRFFIPKNPAAMMPPTR